MNKPAKSGREFILSLCFYKQTQKQTLNQHQLIYIKIIKLLQLERIFNALSSKYQGSYVPTQHRTGF